MKRKTMFMLFALALFAVQQVSAIDMLGYCGAEGENAQWHFYSETGKLVISGSGAIAGRAWNEGAFCADYADDVTEVVIGEGITGIGNRAFGDGNFSNLVSVTLPSTLVSMGECAFHWCSKLASITLPSGVTSIESYAFTGCSALTSVTMLGNVTTIADHAFAACTSLNNVTLPAGLTTIGDAAFHNCTSLNNMSVNKVVGVTMGDDVFGGSTPSTGTLNYTYGADYKNTVWWTVSGNKLQGWSWAPLMGQTILYTTTEGTAFTPDTSKGTFGANITSNTYEDGQGCIQFDSNVTTIPEGAFNGRDKTNSISSIDLPQTVTSIGANAFLSCGSLKSITIPGSVTSIGSNAFQWCISLTSVTIPGSVTSTGFSAFNGCTSLKSVTISSGVTTIAGYAFYGCTSLESITIPSSVTTIYENAFEDCTSLGSITFPSSVTSIGNEALKDCSGLYEITINKAKGVTLGDDVFGGTTPAEGTVYYLCGEKYKESAWWTNTSNKLQGWEWERILDPNRVIEYTRTNMESPLGLSTKADGKTYVTWSEFGANKVEDIEEDGKRYVIFDGNVTTIPEYAFKNNSTLRSIVIPPSVTVINDWAFWNCGVEYVTLPKSLSRFYTNTFHYCSVKVLKATSSSVPLIKRLNGNSPECAFDGCNNLVGLYVPFTSESTYYNQWGLNVKSYNQSTSSTKIQFYPYTELSISPSVKWGTCIVTFDCTLPEGVKAYKCASINSDAGYLVLTDETTEIKNRTPYILYAEDGCVAAEMSGLYDNHTPNSTYTAGKLTGVIRQQTVTSDASNYKYVLQNHAGEGVKFYKIAQGVNHNVKPGKCWLTLTASEAASAKALGFEYGRTEMETILDEQPLDGPIYDLQGREVTEMEVGNMYIMNGQKILKIK